MSPNPLLRGAGQTETAYLAKSPSVPCNVVDACCVLVGSVEHEILRLRLRAPGLDSSGVGAVLRLRLLRANPILTAVGRGRVGNFGDVA